MALPFAVAEPKEEACEQEESTQPKDYSSEPSGLLRGKLATPAR